MPQPRVAVDALGGDHGPAVVVDGAVLARRELGVAVSLVGPEARVRRSSRATGPRARSTSWTPRTRSAWARR